MPEKVQLESQPDFATYFATELRPALATFDTERKRILGKVLLMVGVVVVVAGGLAVVVPEGFKILVVALGLGSVALAWSFLTRDYVLSFKRNVISKIVKFSAPELIYQPARGIDQGQYSESNIFRQRVDRYKSEDLMSGKLDATELRFSEIHSEYKTTTTDSKGRTRTQWHTIFKGLFIMADFNKRFSGCTLVLPDRAERWMGFVGKKLQEMNFTAPGELVKLENPDFEKAFVVYSDDQVEARYILSTSFMERLLAFKEKIDRPVHISFAHATMFIAIATGRNMFEPRIFRSVLDPELVHEYIDDVALATGVVADLNLNQRIWGKV